MIAKREVVFLERHTMKKLALAAFLLDDYSKGKPIGRIDVFLKGRKEKPIKNLSSYYLFLDLPDDSYTVQVKSDYYFDEDSDPINPAERAPKKQVNVTLKPKPSYPFPPGATLIRGVVQNTDGHVVANARLTVKILTPEENKSAEIAPQVSAGVSSIRLAEIADINKEDVYMIKDSNKVQIEFCRIADIPENPTIDPYNLEKSLRFDHVSGTQLHKMVEERTLDVKHTEKGEFVVYFSIVKSYKTLAELEISYPDHTKETIRDIEVEEGKTTSLESDEL